MAVMVAPVGHPARATRHARFVDSSGTWPCRRLPENPFAAVIAFRWRRVRAMDADVDESSRTQDPEDDNQRSVYRL